MNQQLGSIISTRYINLDFHSKYFLLLLLLLSLSLLLTMPAFINKVKIERLILFSFLARKQYFALMLLSLIIKSPGILKVSKILYLFNSHSYAKCHQLFGKSAITGNCSSRKILATTVNQSILPPAHSGVNFKERGNMFAINASHQKCWQLYKIFKPQLSNEQQWGKFISTANRFKPSNLSIQQYSE